MVLVPFYVDFLRRVTCRSLSPIIGVPYLASSEALDGACYFLYM